MSQESKNAEAAFLGKKMLITEPILVEIKEEVDAWFEGKNYMKNQYDEFTIAKLSQKIIELQDQVDSLKRQIK